MYHNRTFASYMSPCKYHLFLDNEAWTIRISPSIAYGVFVKDKRQVFVKLNRQKYCQVTVHARYALISGLRGLAALAEYFVTKNSETGPRPRIFTASYI